MFIELTLVSGRGRLIADQRLSPDDSNMRMLVHVQQIDNIIEQTYSTRLTTGGTVSEKVVMLYVNQGRCSYYVTETLEDIKLKIKAVSVSIPTNMIRRS